MTIELDYDLSACLDYNDVGIAKDAIVAVLAVWEGENDGDDWRWVVQLNDGRFAFIQGGCDYTGWDCQSWATAAFADAAAAAAKFATGEETPTGTCLDPLGLSHMLGMLTGEYMANRNEVYESLMRQLTTGKDRTWREEKDAEFGVISGRPDD